MTLDVEMPMMNIETNKASYVEEARISVLEIYSLNCKNNLKIEVIIDKDNCCNIRIGCKDAVSTR